MAKAMVKQTKNGEASVAKGLIPVLVLGTVVVIAVMAVGRRMTSK